MFSHAVKLMDKVYIISPYGMSYTTTMFHEILLSSFREVTLTNCFSSIIFATCLSSKKGVTPRENKLKFLVDVRFYILCPL